MTHHKLFPEYAISLDRVINNMVALIHDFGQAFDQQKKVSDYWIEHKTREQIEGYFSNIKEVDSESTDPQIAEALQRYNVLLALDERLGVTRQEIEKGNVGAFAGGTSLFSDLVEDFYESPSTGRLYDHSAILGKISDAIGDLAFASRQYKARIDQIPENKRGIFLEFERKVEIIDAWVKVVGGAATLTNALAEGDLDSGLSETLQLGLTIGTESLKAMPRFAKILDDPDVDAFVHVLEKGLDTFLNEKVFNEDWEEKVEHAVDLLRGMTLTDTQLALSFAFERGMSQEHARMLSEVWGFNLETAYTRAAGENDGSTDGEDVIVFGAGDQSVHDKAGDDHYGGGDGSDTISFAARQGIEIVDGKVTHKDGESDRFSRFEIIETTDQADAIDMRSSTADLEIRAGGQDDIVFTGVGNDILEGGAGDDRLEGGDGDDVFLVGDDHGSDEILGGDKTGRDRGIDTINAQRVTDGIIAEIGSRGMRLSEGVEATVEGIEALMTGSGSDKVEIEHLGFALGHIDTGEGDDAITIDELAGTNNVHIDGGADEDSLTFAEWSADMSGVLTGEDGENRIEITSGTLPARKELTFTGLETVDFSGSRGDLSLAVTSLAAAQGLVGSEGHSRLDASEWTSPPADTQGEGASQPIDMTFDGTVLAGARGEIGRAHV